MALGELEEACLRWVATKVSLLDPAHDLLHVKRVVAMAKRLAAAEGALCEIVVPAAWLHDCVPIAKDDARRTLASRLSAAAARDFLAEQGYPETLVAGVIHAIEAHSFSAGIRPRSLEARVLQDADRLDGLGAIGIARCFSTAGTLGRPFYSEDDPFCTGRDPNDAEYTLDHFYQKLLRTSETLQTPAGQQEGRRRAEVMTQYLADLRADIFRENEGPGQLVGAAAG
jgi:uncharacterized protein